jgi:hypothetical protein
MIAEEIMENLSTALAETAALAAVPEAAAHAAVASCRAHAQRVATTHLVADPG